MLHRGIPIVVQFVTFNQRSRRKRRNKICTSSKVISEEIDDRCISETAVRWLEPPAALAGESLGGAGAETESEVQYISARGAEPYTNYSPATAPCTR